MRYDQEFEIARAFDLLPHIVGASWATVWFRLAGHKKPTRKEFRAKAAEYFGMLAPVFESYPADGAYGEITQYVRDRKTAEIRRIMDGQNKEIEKRYDRYVSFG